MRKIEKERYIEREREREGGRERRFQKTKNEIEVEEG